MATVAHRNELSTWIDRSLEYLMFEWALIPDVAAEWDQWDEADRLDFALEWPIREDRLLQLQRWNGDGFLDPTQRRRFVELQRLVKRHRKILSRLLKD